MGDFVQLSTTRWVCTLKPWLVCRHESRGWQTGGCTRCWWIVGNVYCTLQLHLPVRSAQAHTCLSRSQVWLSDPATLHSHWVHCGECLWGGGQHQASVITSKAGIEEPPECVLVLCFTKPMKSKIKMLCYRHFTPMSGGKINQQSSDKHRVQFFLYLAEANEFQKYIFINKWLRKKNK